MRLRYAIILGAIVARAPTAHAQSAGQMLWSDVRHSGGDAWDVWTSPVRGTAQGWLAAAGAITVGAAISPLDDDVDRWAVAHRNDKAFRLLAPIRVNGVAFSGRTITPVALGVLTVALATKNQGLQEGMFGCATSYAASSVVRTFVVYPLFARTRPDTDTVVAHDLPPARPGDQYKVSVPGTRDWGRHAFPGGHFANVASCVSFLTHRYATHALGPVLWTVLGAVGTARTLDRAHWLSDQVVGGFFGYAVGKEIALRSLRRRPTPTPPSASVMRYGGNPNGLFVGPMNGGLGVSWGRRF